MSELYTYKRILPPKRKAVVINRILAVVFLIAIVYFVRYLFFDSKDISLPLLAPFLLLPPLLSFLNSIEKYDLSATFGLLGFNIALFLVAISESLSTGVYLHFVSASAVAISIFEYEKRWKSIAFISLSVSLLLLTNLVSFDLVEYREYSPENNRIFFFVHTLGMAFISCYSIFMLLGHNFGLQAYLRRSHTVVEERNIELRKANEELDRFVYSASHDLRAPLSSIKGLVSLIDKESPSKSEYTPLVMNRISVMEAFIHDIVHYSRNTRVEVKNEKIGLKSLIEEVISSLSHFDNAQDVKIRNKVVPEIEIHTDPYRLKVILTNLISNAIKYADLQKEDSYIDINFSVKKGSCEIKIKDNGIGIDTEHLEKIFTMFYRATLLSQGSGLGLYIANESAQKMGYKLNVESEERKGSTFVIEMPLSTV